MTDTKAFQSFHEFTIEVGGVPVSWYMEDLLNKDAPSLVAHWGHVLAEAEAEQLRVDTEYRTWRAMETLKALKKDPKLSEWKIRAQIEDHPTFRQYKEGVAIALLHAALARGVFEACRARASGSRLSE